MVTFVALLTGRFAGTIGYAMISDGAVETQTFVEENLSAARDICQLCTFGGFVIFTAVNTRPTAGFWIGAMTHVENSSLLA